MCLGCKWLELCWVGSEEKLGFLIKRFWEFCWFCIMLLYNCCFWLGVWEGCCLNVDCGINVVDDGVLGLVIVVVELVVLDVIVFLEMILLVVIILIIL